MARHGKKPSEESTSSHTPRTLAGSATTCTSADSSDAAASGIAVNSSTVSSAFASDADGNTGNTLVGNASNEVEATEVETNATSTNATGERIISSSNTAETSNRQSHESSESRQPQDLFDAAIAQGISDGDAWTDQRVKHIYRQIIIAVVVVVVVLGAVFGFTGVRASQQMRDLAALNDCKEAVTAMNTSYSKAFQLKAKISEAFTSFDGSYDLDKLAELHQTEVTAPKTLSCAADTSATISKANAAKAEYDKQAKQFKQALQKSDESAATDGGDGTDNSAATTERTEPQTRRAMLELPATRAPRTAPSTNPAQPTRPTQRWTINSSSKSTDRNAANQPADQAGQSSQPGLSTKPVISLTIFTFLPTLPYPFSAYPTFLLILESKEKQKRVTWQAKEETLKFRHFQDFTAIKCSNKSKEKCKTRERPNERKGGSHELDSGKWARDHR